MTLVWSTPVRATDQCFFFFSSSFFVLDNCMARVVSSWACDLRNYHRNSDKDDHFFSDTVIRLIHWFRCLFFQADGLSPGNYYCSNWLHVEKRSSQSETQRCCSLLWLEDDNNDQRLHYLYAGCNRSTGFMRRWRLVTSRRPQLCSWQLLWHVWHVTLWLWCDC